jgi:hypothetical protein
MGGFSVEQPGPKPRTKKKVDVGHDSEYLAREMADLLKLDDAALRQRWARVFVADASPHFGRLLMLRSIAYRLQEKAFGCLKRSAERLLDQVCNGPAEDVLERLPKTRASAGTVLIREWRGVRHRVTVLDYDVVCRGQRYKSLSEVACLIESPSWQAYAFQRASRVNTPAAINPAVTIPLAVSAKGSRASVLPGTI